MDPRRRFLRLLSATTPAILAALATGDAQAHDDEDKTLVGTWSVVSTISNGFSFREFLSFADGGVLTETNAFLNTVGNFNFAPFGLNVVAKASDGFGNWWRTGPKTSKATFRKMMFDLATGQNFGDLLVTSTQMSNRDDFSGQSRVVVIDPAGAVLVDLGPVTTVGTRI